MDRRETLKLLLLVAVSCEISLATGEASPQPDTSSFASEWQRWADVRWLGPEYWGNRLQDWCLRKGILECRVLRLIERFPCRQVQIGVRCRY